MSGSRVGTYGQYSLGIFGRCINSPWLGYLRIDYKDGANIEALGFNAGLRYQFDQTQKTRNGSVRPRRRREQSLMIGPESMSAALAGAAFGRTNWNFPQTSTSANPQIAGVLGGGTIGYNKQIDRWVFGVEGDVASTNAIRRAILPGWHQQR